MEIKRQVIVDKESLWERTKQYFDVRDNKKIISSLKQKLKSYEAAKPTRFSSKISVFGSSNKNQEVWQQGRILREEARDSENNNPYTKKILEAYVNNIVGPNGFTMQVNSKFPDQTIDIDANEAVEIAWNEWCQKDFCDLNKNLSFVDILRINIKSLARDGETITVQQYPKKNVNKFGYSLQLLNISRLDHDFFGENKDTRNPINMGIELDSNNTAVKYWINNYIVKEYSNIFNQIKLKSQNERVGYDLKEIIYLSKKEQAEQIRGVTWLHSVLPTLEKINRYEEAELVSAVAASSKVGFLVRKDGLPSDRADYADRKEESGSYVKDIQPGSFEVLESGYEVQTHAPTYSGNYDMFIKSALRKVSSGTGISYETLTSDLSQVNYSSIRAGVLVERDNFIALQNWFIDNYIKTIYKEWLFSALVAGAIKTKNGGIITPDKFDKLAGASFKGRRWAWVDPLKDITAAVLAKDNNITSLSEIVEADGRDLEEVFQRMKADRELAVKFGIELTSTNGNNLSKISDLNNQQDSNNQNNDLQKNIKQNIMKRVIDNHLKE